MGAKLSANRIFVFVCALALMLLTVSLLFQYRNPDPPTKPPSQTLLVADDSPVEFIKPTFTAEQKEIDKQIKSHLQSRTFDDNIVIIAPANDGHSEFVFNLIENLQRKSYTKYTIFAFDDILHKKLSVGKKSSIRVPKHWLETEIQTGEVKWESDGYIALTQAKTNVVYNVLRLGFNVLFTDVDIVWASDKILDHFRFLQTDFRHAELFISLDTDDNKPDVYINSGFYLIKATHRMSEMLERTMVIQRKTHMIDQFSMDDALKELGIKYSNQICYLDKLLFANGHSFIIQKRNQQMGIPAMTIHANYLVGKEAKKNLLKSIDYWFVE